MAAADQVGVVFGENELDLVEELQKFCKTSRMNKSAAMKLLMRAALLDDPVSVETLRAMKGFTGAAVPVARNRVAA